MAARLAAVAPPGPPRRLPSVLLALGLAIGLAGCGADAPRGSATYSGGAVATSPASSSAAPPASPSPTAATSAPSAATRPGAPVQALATTAVTVGTPYGQGPPSGRLLAVMGVAAGGTLPLRAAPGEDAAVLRGLAPAATRLVSTGRARLLGSGTATAVWVEVSGGATVGWVDGGHVAAPADTTDLTAEVVERLGARPSAATMLALGRQVAAAYVSEEPPSTVTVTVPPSAGDLGEVTLDVVGMADDSVTGLRLHVFGTPGAGAFTLKSVEATPFCARGVTPAGLCS